jgi:hypothetical protein
MRKVLFPLLLATAVAATPAVAQRVDNQDRQTARQDRQAARQDARAERQQSRSQAGPEAAARGPSNFQAARPNFAAQSNVQPQARGNFDRQQWSRQAPNTERPQAAFDGHANTDSVANWRQQQRDQTRQERYSQDGQRDQTRQERYSQDGQRDYTRQERYSQDGQRDYTRTAPPSYARPDRSAQVPQTAYNYNQRRSPQWSTNWRNDRRYNWRDYRNQHQSVFRVGAYYDPFGRGYQRFNIGLRLYPAYYEQNYWLADPYMYDLPPAPYPLQWVRYYDDALLVNVFTGQVVDVMYDFFW